jgi:hypothetical protein
LEVRAAYACADENGPLGMSWIIHFGFAVLSALRPHYSGIATSYQAFACDLDKVFDIDFTSLTFHSGC